MRTPVSRFRLDRGRPGRLPLSLPRAVDTAHDVPLASAAVGSRVAVLASGTGSNLQALLDDPDVRPSIALVVSDREESGALQRAEEVGVASIFLDPKAHAAREEYDQALLNILTLENIDCVVLAGFMRILSGQLVRAFEGRMLNIHPALLPSFPGSHAVRDALAWGAKVTGVTIHFVDEQVDHGPIVLQQAVPIEPDDDEAALLDRIHRVEHELYPRAVKLLVEGRIKVEGRKVRVES
jgi:phosphoribosylglycinamide formyltransferase 1